MKDHRKSFNIVVQKTFQSYLEITIKNTEHCFIVTFLSAYSEMTMVAFGSFCTLSLVRRGSGRSQHQVSNYEDVNCKIAL